MTSDREPKTLSQQMEGEDQHLKLCLHSCIDAPTTHTHHIHIHKDKKEIKRNSFTGIPGAASYDSGCYQVDRTNQDTGLVLSEKEVLLYTWTYGGRESKAEVFREG